MDLLLPSTDAGVAVQAMIWTLLLIVGLGGTRRSADWRLLVVGFALLGYGLMAVRAVH